MLDLKNMEKEVYYFFNETTSDSRRLEAFDFIYSCHSSNSSDFLRNVHKLADKKMILFINENNLKIKIMQIISKHPQGFDILIKYYIGFSNVGIEDSLNEYHGLLANLFSKEEVQDMLNYIKEEAYFDNDMAINIIAYKDRIGLTSMEHEKLCRNLLQSPRHFNRILSNMAISESVGKDLIIRFIGENENNLNLYRLILTYKVYKMEEIGKDIQLYALTKLFENFTDYGIDYYVNSILNNDYRYSSLTKEISDIIYKYCRDSLVEKIKNSFVSYHRFFTCLYRSLSEEDKEEYYRKLNLYANRKVNNIYGYLDNLNHLYRTTQDEDLKVRIDNIQLLLKLKG